MFSWVIFQYLSAHVSLEINLKKLQKNYSVKEYAKHCSNDERTLEINEKFSLNLLFDVWCLERRKMEWW